MSRSPERSSLDELNALKSLAAQGKLLPGKHFSIPVEVQKTPVRVRNPRWDPASEDSPFYTATMAMRPTSWVEVTYYNEAHVESPDYPHWFSATVAVDVIGNFERHAELNAQAVDLRKKLANDLTKNGYEIHMLPHRPDTSSAACYLRILPKKQPPDLKKCIDDIYRSVEALQQNQISP